MSDNLDLNYAQILNISIAEGATFALSLYVKDADENPIDISNYTASLKIVDSKQKRNLLQELTEVDGLQLGNGSLGIKKDLNITQGRYYYFLKLTGDLTENWLEGAFIIQ